MKRKKAISGQVQPDVIKTIIRCPFCGTPEPDGKPRIRGMFGCGTYRKTQGVACQKICDLEAWKEQAINAYPQLMERF